MNSKTAYFLGVASGVVLTKTLPNWKVVKIARFGVEVAKAHRRLSKIVINEYERIDEAINAEQLGLGMISPDVDLSVTFSVKDDGEHRSIHTEISKKATV